MKTNKNKVKAKKNFEINVSCGGAWTAGEIGISEIRANNLLDLIQTTPDSINGQRQFVKIGGILIRPNQVSSIKISEVI